MYICTLHLCKNRKCKIYNTLIPFLVDRTVDSRDNAICFKCSEELVKVETGKVLKERLNKLVYRARKKKEQDPMLLSARSIMQKLSKKWGWKFFDWVYKKKQLDAIILCLKLGVYEEDFIGCYNMVTGWGFTEVDFNTLYRNMNRYILSKQKGRKDNDTKYNNDSIMQKV